MPKSEIIDLTLCFISIVGLLVNCYLFYRNSKKFMETEDTHYQFLHSVIWELYMEC